MAGLNDEYCDFIVDQLRVLGPVSHKRMFSGYGLYHEGTFFGIVADGRFYLKTTENDRARFSGRGMGPFRPNARQTLTSYYEAPIEVVENPDELAVWAQRAVAAKLAEE